MRFSLNCLNSDAAFADYWATLPKRRQREIMRLVNSLPLWEPHPQNIPQQQAFKCQADVLGYGGAAGGGKSDVILGLAVTRHKRSIIYRQQIKNLRPLIDRSREIIGTRGHLNENTGVWKMNDGRQIEFGGLDAPGDEHKYQGSPHDFIGYDEGCQIREAACRFTMGWLRTTDPEQRCRVVFGFNPPQTAEQRWIVKFFGPWLDRKHPRPAAPGELRWYATVDGADHEMPDDTPILVNGERIKPLSRTFIPAFVRDNPYQGAAYLSVLNSTPEPLRSQLLFGDFDAGTEDDPWQVIPTAWVEAAMNRWRPDGGKGLTLSAVGVDVARGGRDKTTLAPRRGRWFAPLLKYPGRITPDGPSVCRLVEQALGREREALVCLDIIGVGSSAYDFCCRAGLKVFGVNFGMAARQQIGVMTFANLRAFGYWSMRDLLDPANDHNVALPPDRELLADLTAPKWSSVGGVCKVEAKEDIIKRIGRSPDCADAIVNSILLPGV